jgi:hypothetical protein
MGLRPFTCSAAGLLCAGALTLSLSACAAGISPAENAMSLQGGAQAAAKRTVTLTGIRTTNYIKGTLQVRRLSD